jgi:hypothetical protein
MEGEATNTVEDGTSKTNETQKAEQKPQRRPYSRKGFYFPKLKMIKLASRCEKPASLGNVFELKGKHADTFIKG